MLWYVIRRLVGAVVLLIVMSIATFLLFYATPTDPARLTCGKNCNPQQLAINRGILGLDKPLYTRYFEFVGGFVHDRKFPDDTKLAKAHPELITKCDAPCLGYSPQANNGSLIWTYLKPRLPVTLGLTIGAAIIWLISGVLLGILAALRRGKLIDRMLVSGSLIFYSFPTFFISLLLLEIIVFQFKLLQTPTYHGLSSGLGTYAYNMFLPCLTLALVYGAAYVRLTRTYMLETMNEDYLRTARAKGLKGRTHHLQAHAARGADADRHDRRPRPRRAAGRCADHRDGVQLPGLGQAAVHVGDPLRPADDRGHRAAVRGLRHRR